MKWRTMLFAFDWPINKLVSISLVSIEDADKLILGLFVKMTQHLINLHDRKICKKFVQLFTLAFFISV